MSRLFGAIATMCKEALSVEKDGHRINKAMSNHTWEDEELKKAVDNYLSKKMFIFF